VLGPVERLVYRSLRLLPDREQTWKAYARSLLIFSQASIVGLWVLQRAQGLLSVNPDRFGAVEPYLALNTAVSFATNTNWQNYLGEATMSHLTQMAGLATQNFVSAGVGLAVAVAMIRGLTRRRAQTIGYCLRPMTELGEGHDHRRPAAGAAQGVPRRGRRGREDLRHAG
jgi:K+-transporting ATPase ATPase A chain